MQDKERAKADFIKMILDSWTFSRLTEQERGRLAEALDVVRPGGTYEKRIEHLHDIYHAFLLGVGYTPTGWRETDTDRPLF